jgi:hypothetical protein
MAMVFPTSPTVGQVFTSGGRSWVWNGSAWDAPSAINVLQVPYGLEFVKSQTIGTSVSSVQITNCFTAEYDAYKIIISGGVCSSNDQQIKLQLGSASTGHNWNLIYNGWTGSSITALASNNENSFQYVGSCNTSALGADITLLNPFEAKPTFGTAYYSDNSNGGTTQLRHTGNTSFTGFTISPGSGTFTGGNISVFGYRKA